MTYLLPTSVEAALDALAGGESTIVAGATDYYPALGASNGGPDDVVDIARLGDLRSIDNRDGTWRIGALTTWTDLVTADLPSAFRGLQVASAQIGGVQIQNVASIGGNLCNASPAADGVPPLLTLDAQVELQSANGTRTLPLDEFILGNRVTARRPDELLTALILADPPANSIGSFEKFGARAYLVISIVMVAAVAEISSGGLIESASISVGACSPVAVRLPDLERDLVGRSIHGDLAGAITTDHLSALSPIDDVRASAEYRLTVTPELIARAMHSCQGAPT